MNRFPYFTPLILIILFQVLCLRLMGIELPASPSPLPGNSHQSSPGGDIYSLKQKALEILRERKDIGSYGDRILATATLNQLGEIRDIYSLSNDIILNGNVYEKMMLIETIIDGSAISKEERFLGVEQERAIIKALLEDNAYVISERTIYHLSMAGDPRWIPAYKKALNANDYYIRAGAARALGRCREKSVIPDLVKKMEAESGWTRLCLAQALMFLGDERGMRWLQEASSESIHSKTRTYALGMRLEAGDLTVLPLLKNHMKVYDDRVREIACRYLSRFAPEDEDNIFIHILAKEDFISVNYTLHRIKTFADMKKSLILGEAYRNAVDNRKILLSIFSDEIEDVPLLLSTIRKLRFEELFCAMLENLYIMNRDKGSALTKSIFASISSDIFLMEKIIDTIGRVGDKKDLSLLEKALYNDDQTIAFHSACAVMNILSRMKNIEDKKP